MNDLKEKIINDIFKNVENNKNVKNIVEADTSGDEKDFKYYLNMVDENGKPFNIPLLTVGDPEYASKYVYYMKLRETNPEAFNNLIMGWK